MDANESDSVTTRHVRGAVAGDAASVEWIVERFSPLLLAQATHRLVGKHAILGRLCSPEDLVQDVWLRALPRLSGLDPRNGRITPVVVKFLATTLLNRLNSLLQARLTAGGDPRTQNFSADSAGLAQESEAIERTLRSEAVVALRNAIERLDPADRSVIVLRGIEQNSVGDVALLLAEKPNTVSVRYRRALEKLKQQLVNSVFDDFDPDGD